MVKGLLCDNNNDIEGYGLAWFSNDDDTTFLKKTDAAILFVTLTITRRSKYETSDHFTEIVNFAKIS